MHHVEKKYYAAPTLSELGDLKQITQAGNAANSDAQQFTDGTAWGIGELAS